MNREQRRNVQKASRKKTDIQRFNRLDKIAMQKFMYRREVLKQSGVVMKLLRFKDVYF